MPLIPKHDFNLIFASQAPSIDQPPIFKNYSGGWGVESRPNNGKPTIKGFNKLQQVTDEKLLWMYQNGAALPFDENIEYVNRSISLKDGYLQQFIDGSWVKLIPRNIVTSIGGETGEVSIDAVGNLLDTRGYDAEFVKDESGKTQQEINNKGVKDYSANTEYLENSIVVKDGILVQKKGDEWKPVGANKASDILDESGLTQQEWNNGVESVADLALIQNPEDGNRVFVKSYHKGLNKGGGVFIYDSTKSTINDGGLCINGWVLTFENLKFENFGAKGDGSDDTAAIQLAIDSVLRNNLKSISGTSGSDYGINTTIKVWYRGVYRDAWVNAQIDFTGTRLIPLPTFLGDDELNTVLRVERDFCKIIRPVFYNLEHEVPNLTAYAFAPDSYVSDSKQRSQMFIDLIDPTFHLFKHGVVHTMGANAESGAEAGSYYNSVTNPIFNRVDLAVWLKGNSNVNNNLNTRFTIFNPRHIIGNCTFLLDSFDTFTCFGGSSEFINSGTYPLATPTVIKAREKNHPSQLWANNGASFIRFGCEVCTQFYDGQAENVSFVDPFFITVDKIIADGSYISKSQVLGSIEVTNNVGGWANFTAKDEKSGNLIQMYANDKVVGIETNKESIVLPPIKSVKTNEIASYSGSLVLRPTKNVASNSAIDIVSTSKGTTFYNTSQESLGKYFNFGGITILGVGEDNEVSLCEPTKRLSNIHTVKANVSGLAIHPDNQSAKNAGLAVGDFFRTSSGVVMVVY